MAIALIWGAIAAVSLANRGTQDLQLSTESTTANVRVDNECGPIALREGPVGVVTTEREGQVLMANPHRDQSCGR